MSNAHQTIHLERMGAVAILTLSRPERMNAINKQMLGELQDALDDVERDDELRVLVVKGAGGNFSSGFDLKEQMEAQPSGLTAWREILDRDFSTVTRFWHFKKPTIAAVRDPADTANTASILRDVEAAARAIGLQVQVLKPAPVSRSMPPSRMSGAVGPMPCTSGPTLS